MNVFQIAFTVLLALFLAGAFARWKRTPSNDPDYAARWDTTRLAVVMLAGQILVLARARFAFGTPGFYACSVVLLPIVLAALWLLKRLFGAYRQTRS